MCAVHYLKVFVASFITSAEQNTLLLHFYLSNETSIVYDLTKFHPVIFQNLLEAQYVTRWQ